MTLTSSTLARLDIDAVSPEYFSRLPDREATSRIMPDTTSPRYEGVTSYTSYSVSEELAQASAVEAEYLLSYDPIGAALTLPPASSQYLAAIPEI